MAKRLNWASRLVLVLASFSGISGLPAAGEETTFANPIYAGQDPYVLWHEGAYYMAASAPGDRAIYVYKSDRLTDPGVFRVAYQPEDGPYGHQLWAPEIHHIDGEWYIYTCADNGDNANHRLVVLQAETDDPQGPYRMAAVLKTPSWAIDETVFRGDDGGLYCLYSGWPVHTKPDSTQHIFISRMKSPTELEGEPTDISGKMLPWETSGRPDGLNEGPQVLRHDGRLFAFYACSGSWTADYCLGLLEHTGGDLLDAKNWKKHPEPALRRSGNVYGPGHGCVTKSPDGTEDWLVYHSSIDQGGSWNRSISIKPFRWKPDGTPDFGTPPAWGATLEAPSGEPELKRAVAVTETFENEDRWQPYGFFRDRTIAVDKGELVVRGTRDARYEDKVLLRGNEYLSCDVAVDIRRLAGDGAAGILFRATDCAIGENRFKGYVVRLGADGILTLGKSDGEKFTAIATKSIEPLTDATQRLRVVARGAQIRVYIDNAAKPALEATDSDYSRGRVGVQAAKVDAAFDNFAVNLLPRGMVETF